MNKIGNSLRHTNNQNVEFDENSNFIRVGYPLGFVRQDENPDSLLYEIELQTKRLTLSIDLFNVWAVITENTNSVNPTAIKTLLEHGLIVSYKDSLDFLTKTLDRTPLRIGFGTASDTSLLVSVGNIKFDITLNQYYIWLNSNGFLTLNDIYQDYFRKSSTKIESNEIKIQFSDDLKYLLINDLIILR
jgi:hypothetical protein